MFRENAANGCLGHGLPMGRESLIIVVVQMKKVCHRGIGKKDGARKKKTLLDRHSANTPVGVWHRGEVTNER